MRGLRTLAPLWIAAASLLVSGVIALTLPIPAPQFHDEFSYLLAGDTFARGRLTSPRHELSDFFESFQVLVRPTYASKYPQGQGLTLATGQVLFGLPIAGVWIVSAAACAAAWWALRAMVPARWALIGALIVATHPLMLKWNFSNCGGGVAMLGGALLVGGTVRMRRWPGIGAGIALGTGLFILAISRPFEGAVLAILSVLLLRAPSPRPSPGRRGRTVAALSALGGVMLIGGAWIGYYNWRVTGSAMTLPYLLYESQYAANPPFLWMARAGQPPEYTSNVMRDYYLGWELPQYERGRREPLTVIGEKLWSFLKAYFYSIALVAPVAMAIVVLPRDRLARAGLVVATIFALVAFGNLWFFPHYTAAAVVVYLLIVVQGLRHLRVLPGGRWIVRGVLALHLVAAGVWWSNQDRTRGGWNHLRADLIAEARGEGRKLLIIVRPGGGYYAHNEWVYNDADIDASPVVFARDHGDDNARLLAYFNDRDVMVLEIGGETMRLEDMRDER